MSDFCRKKTWVLSITSKLFIRYTQRSVKSTERFILTIIKLGCMKSSGTARARGRAIIIPYTCTWKVFISRNDSHYRYFHFNTWRKRLVYYLWHCWAALWGLFFSKLTHCTGIDIFICIVHDALAYLLTAKASSVVWRIWCFAIDNQVRFIIVVVKTALCDIFAYKKERTATDKKGLM